MERLVTLDEGDAGEVLTLQRAAYVTEAQAHGDLQLPPLRQSLRELTAELGRADVLALGWRDGRGRLLAAVRTTLTAGRTVAEIGRLTVAPDRQGEGLGSGLLAELEKRLPVQVRELRLFTGERSEANLRLYRRLGYSETHRVRTPAGYALVHLSRPRTSHTAHTSPLGLLRTASATADLRLATVDDVPAIVGLLAEDSLGATRERAADAAALPAYLRAFVLIDEDPAHLLLVADIDDAVVATMQVSFLPGLARGGAPRAQLEAIRVRTDHRRSGLGREMVTWAIEEARRRGCALVQLTSDKQRPEAHRFYSGLGFVASHEGFKRAL